MNSSPHEKHMSMSSEMSDVKPHLISTAVSYQQQPMANVPVLYHQQQVPPGGMQFAPVPFGQTQAQPQYNARPIATLREHAAIVECPACGTRALTQISYQTGQKTHLWAGIGCLLTGVGWISYLVNNTKDVVHMCSNCGSHIYTWRR